MHAIETTLQVTCTAQCTYEKRKGFLREHFKHTAHKTLYCAHISKCFVYVFCAMSKGQNRLNFRRHWRMRCQFCTTRSESSNYCCAKTHMRCERLHHHRHLLSSQRRDRLWNLMNAHRLRQTDRLFRIHAHKSAFFPLLSRNLFCKHLFNFDFYCIDFRRKRFFLLISPRQPQQKQRNINSMPAKTFTIKRFIFRISNDFLEQR